MHQKIAVIAGIGTRNYYRKRGYHLEGTYELELMKIFLMLSDTLNIGVVTDSPHSDSISYNLFVKSINTFPSFAHGEGYFGT